VTDEQFADWHRDRMKLVAAMIAILRKRRKQQQ
jgi:hypothetical protein